MKSKVMILTAMLTALPSAMMAQQNIQKAFDALLNEEKVEIKTQHSLEVDSETGRKIEQADVYDFTVSTATGLGRINDVRKAFEKDKDSAYHVRSGSKVGDNYTALAVGEGGQPVAIGAIDGSEFIYACFLDKDDPEKRYRYAYALEWVEKGERTQVRLAITYALSQQSRSHRISKIIVNGKEINVDDPRLMFERRLRSVLTATPPSDSITSAPVDRSIDIGNIGNPFDVVFGDWLSNFNNYKNLFLKNPEGTAANVYASRIYNLCKKADELDDAEKELVIKEIRKLTNKTKDDFVQQLFEMSIERLKK